jgi:hypothetical protein
MQVNLPSVSDQGAATVTYALVLSEESIGILNLALAAICTDALDAEVSPERAFHLMRDWHRTRDALEAVREVTRFTRAEAEAFKERVPFPGLG